LVVASEHHDQQRRRRHAKLAGLPGVRYARIAKDLLEQDARFRIPRRRGDLVLQVPDQLARHFFPVHHNRPQIVRIDEPPHHVRVRASAAEILADPAGRAVGREHIPAPVEHERRVRLLVIEDERDSPAHRRQLRGV
jgi:hypothetical protein